ncbi:flagellar hook-associated protein FlgL [Propionivibrio limicola]|uniref:flagellar hook-associated protein FlgL n=1 Tax=Propionivibrio limicola TaxID=167645 RepID=UPI001290FD5E|nr:flagellar hook-associated protein FlgL [Propionivibrio limicola]
MRISTSQIYGAGARSIMDGQSSLYRTQNQLSSGKQFLSAQDDPVAAAQVMLDTQALAVNSQFADNQGNALSQLAFEEDRLQAVVDALQDARTNVIAGGNASYTDAERGYIADELESQLELLYGLANSTDSNGYYLFSGYQGNTQPFAKQTDGTIAYQGDNGKRLLQVDSERQIAVSDSGHDVFVGISSGNGTYTVSNGTMTTAAASANTGTGAVDSASTKVTNLSDWSGANGPYQVTFAGGGTTYDITDADGNSVVAAATYTAGDPITTIPGVSFSISGVPADGDTFTIEYSDNAGTGVIDSGSVTNLKSWSAANPPYQIAFTSDSSVTPYAATYTITDADGAAVVSDVEYEEGVSIAAVPGVSFSISGEPANGDTFAIEPSTEQSVFTTLQNLITAFRTGVSGDDAAKTKLQNTINAELQNLDKALTNISGVQSTVGSRMNEVESLQSVSSALDIHYQERISNLSDLDYAEAIARFAKQQLQLEAAQSSFSKISGLSLFNYL